MAAAPNPSSPALTRDAALRCVPVRNSGILTEQLENGLVRITYPARTKPWLAALVKRFSRHAPDGVFVRRLELDQLGAFVWQTIDDRRSVRSIVQHFAATQQVNPREAEVSVTQFLRELGIRGIIGMREVP